MVYFKESHLGVHIVYNNYSNLFGKRPQLLNSHDLMKKTILITLKRMLLILALFSSLSKPVRSETSPYCRLNTTCSVSCSANFYTLSSFLSNLIDGTSYKASVTTLPTIGPPAAGYLNYSIWFKID